MITKSIKEIVKSNKELIQIVKQNKDIETSWKIGVNGKMQAYNDNLRKEDYDYQPIKQGDYQELTAIADDEIFKFWNGYFISIYARVYSTKQNRFISPYLKDQHGYYQVDLYDNGNHKSERFSNLVAGLFDTDFENNRYFGEIIDWNDLHVHHVDKNKENNRADNLVILTSADHRLVHKALKTGMNLDTVAKIDAYIFIERERREHNDSNKK